MSKDLILEELSPEGQSLGEIGRLITGEVVVGREPTALGGLTVKNNAISRNHGAFVRIRSHWFYKDLGSTNGSWLNGRQIKEGQLRLVRPGDVVQLADSVIRVTAVSDASQPGDAGLPTFNRSTLIVFSGDSYLDEYPVAEYGRALVIGGAQADLKLDGASELPRFVIERRGEEVIAYPVSQGAPILVNGQEVSSQVTLTDGDEVKVGDYLILFNDPRAIKGLQQAMRQGVPRGIQAQTADLTGSFATTAVKSWELPEDEPISEGQLQGVPLQAKRGSSNRFTFGQSSYQDEDPEGTVAIDPADVEARLASYDLHPSSRYAMPVKPTGSSLKSVEDRVIIGIGFVILVVLFVVVVWWVFL